MEFRTVVPPLKHRGLISHTTPLLLLGSCFTNNIGSRLADDMMDVTINPTGTLYNPLSVADAIDRLITGEPYSENDLFFHQGLWRSLDHHSSFASADKHKALARINDSLINGKDAVNRAAALIVTWGSSIAYKHVKSGAIAANCHKLPADEFEVIQLTIDSIIDRWEQTLSRIKSINPDLTVIYTVSPIRHKAYGLEGNTLNKARLIEASHYFASYPGAIYFPSYEIMMDDLRDYRFYAADMIHPSETACDYIYEIFSQSFFDHKTTELASRSRKLTVRSRHRTMTDNREISDSFKQESINLLNNHLTAHPELERAVKTCLTHLNDLQSIKNS